MYLSKHCDAACSLTLPILPLISRGTYGEADKVAIDLKGSENLRDMNSSAILNVSGWKVVFISKLSAWDRFCQFRDLVRLKSVPTTAGQVDADRLSEQSPKSGTSENSGSV